MGCRCCGVLEGGAPRTDDLCEGCVYCGRPCRRSVRFPYKDARAAATTAWMALGHMPLEFELRDIGAGARLAPDGRGWVLAAAAVALTTCAKCDDALAVGVCTDGEDSVQIRNQVIPAGRCGAI